MSRSHPGRDGGELPPGGLHSPPWFRWLIPLLFLLTAWWLYAYEPEPVIPFEEPAGIDASLLAPLPKAPRPSAPVTEISGFEMRCNACHRLFESKRKVPEHLKRHDEIVLKHGANDRCYNCHSRKNRERFVRHDGTWIPFETPELLCAKCHGPTFRDWQKGIHGKTLGSWIPTSDKLTRLRCNNCHDPHSPAFEQVYPMPAPRTLRMVAKEKKEGVHPEGKERGKGPLDHWMYGEPRTHQDGTDDPHGAPAEGERE